MVRATRSKTVAAPIEVGKKAGRHKNFDDNEDIPLVDEIDEAKPKVSFELENEDDIEAPEEMQANVDSIQQMKELHELTMASKSKKRLRSNRLKRDIDETTKPLDDSVLSFLDNLNGDNEDDSSDSSEDDNNLNGSLVPTRINKDARNAKRM